MIPQTVPDGAFTRAMGMLAERTANGMGLRRWRNSMPVEDRRIEKLFAEPGFRDNPEGVPLEAPDTETMLSYLEGR